MGGFFGFLYRQLAFTPRPVAATKSLEGRTVLITGANIGLGLEAARELSLHKPLRLILAVRDTAKGEAAKNAILKTSPGVEIEVWPLDYDSYDSIISFGNKAAALDLLDFVLLSAGVKQLKYSVSHTGHETNVQINHLGTSLLSLLLLPTLQRTARVTGEPSRMTIASSEGHFWIPFKERTAPKILARMDEEKTFGTAMQRYYTTKLLNVLWTRALASRINKDEVILNTVNPGFCYSGLHRYEASGTIRVFLWLFGWSTEQGGHCLADALVNHGDSHGQYLSEQEVTKYVIVYLNLTNADYRFLDHRNLSSQTKAKLRRSRYGVKLLHC